MVGRYGTISRPFLSMTKSACTGQTSQASTILSGGVVSALGANAVAAADAKLAVDSDRQLADLLFDDVGHGGKLMDPERVGQTR
jgi:hypothetical protein